MNGCELEILLIITRGQTKHKNGRGITMKKLKILGLILVFNFSFSQNPVV